MAVREGLLPKVRLCIRELGLELKPLDGRRIFGAMALAPLSYPALIRMYI